ncbi:hypothetical protein WOLCODRAFT_156307 [Wolfiporia cocos MD-104 SS10]|uniref:Uncharacterized protein n=1 Tax=Wolfiporia cocos (strain MD-104) TaxID=742152 RepID=A0A2H3J1N6_WOLCO|nr:hypothetical protein WOLCODRAFT_156307 [Wolfiporia cocos MD-104 SS10]
MHERPRTLRSSFGDCSRRRPSESALPSLTSLTLPLDTGINRALRPARSGRRVQRAQRPIASCTESRSSAVPTSGLGARGLDYNNITLTQIGSEQQIKSPSGLADGSLDAKLASASAASLRNRLTGNFVNGNASSYGVLGHH